MWNSKPDPLLLNCGLFFSVFYKHLSSSQANTNLRFPPFWCFVVEVNIKWDTYNEQKVAKPQFFYYALQSLSGIPTQHWGSVQEQCNHSPLQSSLHPSQGILYLCNVRCICAHLQQKTRNKDCNMKHIAPSKYCFTCDSLISDGLLESSCNHPQFKCNYMLHVKA